jgi:predicted metal-dependent hydrolase
MKLGELDIAVSKSKRKTVSIYIERDGSVSALVPETIADEELKEVLKSKEYQIHKNLAEWSELNENKVNREYVNGQSFLYFGRNYRLKIVEEADGKVLFSKGFFTIGRDDLPNAKELFTEFYREKLKDKLPPLVDINSKKIGVDPNDIKVMELQNRWASCSSLGNVNFHWKCAMAPMDVLNYIVVHELVHLIHQNHSEAFWNEVDKVLPRYEKQKHWLRVNGAGMGL